MRSRSTGDYWRGQPPLISDVLVHIQSEAVHGLGQGEAEDREWVSEQVRERERMDDIGT